MNLAKWETFWKRRNLLVGSIDWTDERIETGKRLYLAIESGQIEEVLSLCAENPWLVSDHTWLRRRNTWIAIPAIRGNVEMMKTLLELGFNANALSGKEQSTALDTAVGFDHLELTKFLLENGADPNLSRPIIGALNERKPPEMQLAFLQTLVEGGGDVNRLYDLYGDSSKKFTALDWAKDPKVIAFLTSVGAKTSAEVSGVAKK